MSDVKPTRRRGGEKGTTLIEVLIAMFVLLLLILGVLQLFSVSMAMNLGAGARTEMTYKAMEVMEVLRWANSAEAPVAWAGRAPLMPDGEYPLPTNSGEAGWDFWGPPTGTSPNALNVLQEENGPFMVSYTVTDTGTDYLVVVRARPNPNAGRSYQGMGATRKEIDYAATIPKL